MIVFDTSNIHFVWDDSLKGKSCYFADSVMDLANAISIHDLDKMGVVEGFGDLKKPFLRHPHEKYSLVYPIDSANSWSYNKAYVKFEWDTSLEGKRGLMANSIGQIQAMIIRNERPILIRETRSNEHPFKDTDGKCYKFAYIDPYYDFRYDFLNGKPVEFKWDGEWRPLKHSMFILPPSYYRFGSENTVSPEVSSSPEKSNYESLSDVKSGYNSGATVLRRVKGCSEMSWVTDHTPSWDSETYDYKLATKDDGIVGDYPLSKKSSAEGLRTKVDDLAEAFFTNKESPSHDSYESVRSHNVGSSDYSTHKIQPWDIWLEYKLNPFDADIVKRVLRKKSQHGKSSIQSRTEDYEKIIHICQERICQLSIGSDPYQ